MTPPLRIFLADDQSLVRSGFRMLIDAEDDMQVVGEATNGLGAVTALSAAALPDTSSTTSESARFWNHVPVFDTT